MTESLQNGRRSRVNKARVSRSLRTKLFFQPEIQKYERYGEVNGGLIPLPVVLCS